MASVRVSVRDSIRVSALERARHTTESTWFGKTLKEALPHSDIDKEVHFTKQHEGALAKFDQTMREELSAETRALQARAKKSGDTPVVSKARLLSKARLYRIASSLPFLVEFWNMPGHAHIQLTSKEMNRWIHNGQMDPDCPLSQSIPTMASKYCPRTSAKKNQVSTWGCWRVSSNGVKK